MKKFRKMKNGKWTFFLAGLAAMLSQCNLMSQTLSPVEFRKGSANPGAVIIDVRSNSEFAESHIAGAVNYNVEDSLFTAQVGSLDRSGRYYLYCGIGKRSARAAGIMRRLGFGKVYELEKGLEEWKEQKLPVVSGSQ